MTAVYSPRQTIQLPRLPINRDTTNRIRKIKNKIFAIPIAEPFRYPASMTIPARRPNARAARTVIPIARARRRRNRLRPLRRPRPKPHLRPHRRRLNKLPLRRHRPLQPLPWPLQLRLRGVKHRPRRRLSPLRMPPRLLRARPKLNPAPLRQSSRHLPRRNKPQLRQPQRFRPPTRRSACG